MRYSNLTHPSWRLWENNEVARQAEMRKKGRNPIALTHSDPPHYGHMNQEISKYLVEAAEKGLHSYSAPMGELRDAICDFEKKYRNVDYSPDNIILTGGVSGALMLIHYAVLDPGAFDEVVVINPTHYAWTPRDVVEALNGKIVFVPMIEEEGWQPDIETLQNRITERTKYICCSVNNPTGTAYDEKTLKEIVDIAGENDVMIVSDEMYGMITYDGVN